MSSSKDVHDESTTLVDLLDEKYLRPTAQGVFRTEVDGYGYRWYRVGSLQTAAERRGAPEPE